MPVPLPQHGKAKPSLKPASADFEARNASLRSKLDDRLDRLTALWRDVEKRLIGLQQPREVAYDYDSVSCSGHPDDPNCDCYCIGIAKYAGKWRLCLGEYNDLARQQHDEPISWRPVTDCTIEERIKAAKHIKKLEHAIVETGERILPRLDDAIRQLEEHLAVRRPNDELADL